MDSTIICFHFKKNPSANFFQINCCCPDQKLIDHYTITLHFLLLLLSLVVVAVAVLLAVGVVIIVVVVVVVVLLTVTLIVLVAAVVVKSLPGLVNTNREQQLWPGMANTL